MSNSKLVQIAIAAMSETKEARVERELNRTLKFMVTDCTKVISVIKGTINTLNDELQAAEDYLNDSVQDLQKVVQTIPNVDIKGAYSAYVRDRELAELVVKEKETAVVNIKNKIIREQKRLEAAEKDLAILTEQA